MASRDFLEIYGSDASVIKKLARQHPPLSEPLHPRLPYTKAQVVWAVRREMARTVEDFLARRIRILFLDAAAAVEMAPEVARLMAEELKKGAEWQKEQIDSFEILASGYLPTSFHGKVLAYFPGIDRKSFVLGKECV